MTSQFCLEKIDFIEMTDQHRPRSFRVGGGGVWVVGNVGLEPKSTDAASVTNVGFGFQKL